MDFRNYIFFFLLFITINPFAQEVNEYDSDEYIDAESFQNDLQEYLQNPLLLNQANKEELVNAPFFTEEQANDILEYRAQNGGFVVLEELNALPSFTEKSINKIQKYIRVKAIKKEELYHQSIILRFRYLSQQSIELTDTLSIHEKIASYFRYQGNMGTKWRFGFLVEQDRQEQVFDFYNGFVQYKGTGLVQQAIVGAYRLQLGQGLLYWNGWGLGKPMKASQVQKNAYPLRPYTSANEVRFMRGASLKLGGQFWDLTTFYSNKNKDAHIENDSVKTLYVTGLHQTPKQKETKWTLNEQVIGANFQVRYHSLKVGLTNSYHQYNHSFLAHTGNYRSSDFIGNKRFNLSFYYNYTYHHTYLFGEIVNQSHGKTAFLQGLSHRVNSSLLYTFLLRYYQNSFVSDYANPFRETSAVDNEQGIYQGIEWNINPKLTLDAYVDLYRFPFLKYQVDFPTKGREYFAQLTYDFSKYTSAYIRYKMDNREESILLSENKLTSKIIRQTEQVRAAINYNYYQWSFQTSVALKNYRKQYYELGHFIGQSVKYNFHFAKRRMNLTYRIAFYDTPSFNTAIYWYEHDVLYLYSLPFYYGQGFRHYVVLRTKLGKSFSCQVKWGYQNFMKPIESQGDEMRRKWDFNIQLISEF
ncbi:MAG: helix-hairpin-helix domain-containing protein [Cytophagales bacterium]|nr:helix-hairpin-helix domain-containing protein [Cytophagales bacterium]